jgi:hypothetical protein
MGTRQHGLLRFDNVDGKWAGRWLTTRSGLPANGVRRLASCRKGAVTELLVIGGDREEGRMDADVSMVWSVNLDTDAVTLIHDGHPHERQIHVPVAVLRDGTKMLLELAGSAAYRDLPSIPDIVSIERGTTYSLPLVAMPFTAAGRPGEVGRIWCPSWDGYRHSLDSFDADTLARCADGAPGAGPGNSGFPAVSDQVRGVLGEIMARPSGGSYGTARIGDWPCMGMPFATGTANVIWLGLNTGGGWNQSRMIVGYRPAPRGTDDWAADDLWIGPFHTPGKELILDLAPAQEPGRYLLSTTGHVMLLDEATILDEATRIGAIRSTRQWRGQYRKRLARAGWRSVVPALLVDERFDDALAVLKAEREKLDRDQGPAERRQVFDFWTARVLADMPGRADDAIAAYDAIASDKDVSGAAEAFARANQVILLHREEHWQALLDVATAFKKRFPQTATRDSLQWYIDEAGQHVRGEPDTGDETSQDAHP